MPPVPPQGGSSLGKITFTHKVLMCLCEHVCVCETTKEKGRQAERNLSYKGSKTGTDQK